MLSPPPAPDSTYVPLHFITNVSSVTVQNHWLRNYAVYNIEIVYRYGGRGPVNTHSTAKRYRQIRQLFQQLLMDSQLRGNLCLLASRDTFPSRRVFFNLSSDHLLDRLARFDKLLLTWCQDPSISAHESFRAFLGLQRLPLYISVGRTSVPHSVAVGPPTDAAVTPGASRRLQSPLRSPKCLSMLKTSSVIKDKDRNDITESKLGKLRPLVAFSTLPLEDGREFSDGSSTEDGTCTSLPSRTSPSNVCEQRC